MRVCVFEDEGVANLEPLTLTRPAFDLRCGAATLLGRQLRCLAAGRAYVSAEQIVPRLDGPPQSMLLNRAMVHGVAETPNGAHFTSCVPDYPRDEAFQARYAQAAADAEEWDTFRAQYLAGDEAAYQEAIG